MRALAGRRPVRLQSRLSFHAIDRNGIVTETVRGIAKPKRKPRAKGKTKKGKAPRR